VVLCWPVIDPLGRYEYAKRLQAGGKPGSDFADRVIPSHHAFWGTEEAMAEGSPVRALERGESVAMPPAIYLQGTEDVAHPAPHPRAVRRAVPRGRGPGPARAVRGRGPGIHQDFEVGCGRAGDGEDRRVRAPAARIVEAFSPSV